jgi:hypothetical protein
MDPIALEAAIRKRTGQLSVRDKHNLAEIHNVIGLLHRGVGKHKEALSHFSEAVGLDQRFYQVRACLACLAASPLSPLGLLCLSFLNDALPLLRRGAN